MVTLLIIKIMENKTFYEISTEWKLMKQSYVKKTTYSAYNLIIVNHLLPYFKDKTSINEADVQEFAISKLNDGLSSKSIKDILIVLKMIITYGNKHGFHCLTDWNIQLPTNQRKRSIEVFNLDVQRKIMKYIKANFTFRNLGIYLCLSTGLRIGEICALQWKDIDINSGLITVSKTIGRIYLIDDNNNKHTEVIIDTPKTKNSNRDIPISNNLIKILRPFKKVVNPQYYVLSNDSTPIEPRTYRNYYKKLIKTLNIPDLKFHSLRHSFATRCIECNCDYKTVSVLLGHSNISTTLNLYVHPNIDQ